MISCGLISCNLLSKVQGGPPPTPPWTWGFYPRSHCKPRGLTQRPARVQVHSTFGVKHSLPVQYTLKGLSWGRQGSTVKGPPNTLSHRHCRRFRTEGVLQGAQLSSCATQKSCLHLKQRISGPGLWFIAVSHLGQCLDTVCLGQVCIRQFSLSLSIPPPPPPLVHLFKP